MRFKPRRRRLKPNKDALREFVYLDEVSVYSLAASRFGALAKDFTATESRTLEAEANSSGGFNVGTVKATVGLRGKAAQTSGTQVVRKAMIQSTFKELYEHETASMVGRTPEGSPPEYSSRAAFETALAAGKLSGWATPASELTRGRLTEVSVELDAEDMFRFSVVVSSMLELVEGNETVFGMSDQGSVGEVATMSRVLDKLLGGLIPLRGTVLTHKRIESGGQAWMVHEALVARLDGSWGFDPRPIDLVGVTEASLFWKDVRRVLFAGSKYTVLCRIGKDDLQSSWTPVKLADVLRDVVPELAAELNGGAGIMASMRRAASAPPSETDERSRMRQAMIAYGVELARSQDKVWTEQDGLAQGIPTAAQIDRFEGVAQRQEAFREFTDALADALELSRDPTSELLARESALESAGLQEGQWSPPTPRINGRLRSLPSARTLTWRSSPSTGRCRRLHRRGATGFQSFNDGGWSTVLRRRQWTRTSRGDEYQ